MLLTLACLVAAAAAAPLTYDQRQDGDFNVAADIQNVLFLVAYPPKIADYFDDLFRSKQRSRDANAQERADHLEAFVEPSTPYKVEIGELAESDGRAAEVVIVSRKKAGAEAEAELESEGEEVKLIGATEQCGPDRERDPVTLTCRWRAGAISPQALFAKKSDSADKTDSDKQSDSAKKSEVVATKPESAAQSDAAPQKNSSSQPDSKPSKVEDIPESPEPSPEVVSA